ncbi:hypothetical protein [Streptomyces sp. KL118A]|uniref:hypothetical protein n=1 Tax=Streptomyces sp. KL118A TaxID=3045153 RepID=UPI00278C81F0|nr:hypothetical protein [Streptomyces sp. KL118A]
MTRRTVRLTKQKTVRRRVEPEGEATGADDRARAVDASRRAGRVTAAAARFLARTQRTQQT